MFVLAHVAARCGVCCVYVGFLCTCMHAFCCVDVVPFGPGRSSFLFLCSCCRSSLSAFFSSSSSVCGRLGCSWSFSLVFSLPFLFLLCLLMFTVGSVMASPFLVLFLLLFSSSSSSSCSSSSLLSLVSLSLSLSSLLPCLSSAELTKRERLNSGSEWVIM